MTTAAQRQALAAARARGEWPEYTGEPRIYRTIRFRFDGRPRTLRNHLTLSEAQAHCQRDDTSSHSTGAGAWFDGYDLMKGLRRNAEGV